MKFFPGVNYRQYGFALSKDINFPHISIATLGGDVRKLIARLIFRVTYCPEGYLETLATVKISEPRNWQTMSPN
jgi:hypothetical protein